MLPQVRLVGMDDMTLTSTICDTCKSKVNSSKKAKLEEYVDRLETPVAVVDSCGMIQYGNSTFCALLGIDRESTRGYSGGDVFECIHSKKPGGCGNTIHCSGCTIRLTVMDTMMYGRNHLYVPAYLERFDEAKTPPVELVVSTELCGDVVLLRIDKLLLD